MALCVPFWLRERIQIARRGPDNVTVYWICFTERRRERERVCVREEEKEKETERDKERGKGWSREGGIGRNHRHAVAL